MTPLQSSPVLCTIAAAKQRIEQRSTSLLSSSARHVQAREFSFHPTLSSSSTFLLQVLQHSASFSVFISLCGRRMQQVSLRGPVQS